MIIYARGTRRQELDVYVAKREHRLALSMREAAVNQQEKLTTEHPANKVVEAHGSCVEHCPNHPVFIVGIVVKPRHLVRTSS